MDAVTITSPFGDEAVETIEHLNEHHDDTVAFVARVMGGLGAVDWAAVSTVDHDGVEFDVVLAGGDRRSVRVGFANRADTSDAAYGEFYAMLAAARERSGESELTSIEREMSGG